MANDTKKWPGSAFLGARHRPGEARVSETIVGRVLELRIYLLFRVFLWSGGDGLVDRSYCSA
jgi:hypothetical protein